MSGLALLVACRPCDFEIDGVCVAYDEPTPSTTKPQWTLVIERSADFWGTPLEALDGWTVTVHDHEVRCGFSGGHSGCTNAFMHTIHVMRISCFADTHCADTTIVAHEIGHVRYEVFGHGRALWDAMTVAETQYWLAACDDEPCADAEEARGTEPAAR